MHVVMVGHVDHGKSTILGRLLADLDVLPQGKLDKVHQFCRQNGKPFEYAFILDALGDELAQGITIDIARCFLKTAQRHYLILDAPGHIEFLKNMVTGAANAEAAFLVIDASEGIAENTRRHAYMLSLLEVAEVVILVNKIDLIDYNEPRFKEIVSEFLSYLEKLNINPFAFIPVSGRLGDNIVQVSSKTPWYKGNTLVQQLDAFKKQRALQQQPFRMSLQDIYKFVQNSDTRRIYAGQIVSGCLSVGDEVFSIRQGINSDLGFSEVDRQENNRRVGEIAIYLAKQAFIVIVSMISPRAGHRQRVRAQANDQEIPFMEVYVKASVDVCRKRDPKRLYQAQTEGKLSDLTGIDACYEPPLCPEIIVDTETCNIEQGIDQLLMQVETRPGF